MRCQEPAALSSSASGEELGLAELHALNSKTSSSRPPRRLCWHHAFSPVLFANDPCSCGSLNGCFA